MTVTLTKPGDEVTMLVKGVATVESTAKVGTFRYQIDGTLANGKEERVYLNTPVVDKQLSHLQLPEATDLTGGWYRFYRVAAPNNTPAAGYLNIEVASKGSAQMAAAPTKRLTEATAKAPPVRSAGQREFEAAVPPDDAPPAFHRDIPPPESEEGELFTPPATSVQLMEERLEARFNAYTQLARKVTAFQSDLAKEYELPFDASSVNAMTFSIWNQR